MPESTATESTAAHTATAQSTPAQRNTKNLSILVQLFRFIKPYRLQAVFALIALIFTVVTNLLMVQGVSFIIDQGFVAGSLEDLNRGTLIIVGLIVLMAAGTFARYLTVSWLGERVSADIRKAVFDHIVLLHPYFFETNRSGEIMSRLTTDTTLLQSIIGSSISMALRSSLLFIGGLIMLFATNFKLSLIVVLAVPLILGPLLWFGRRVRKLSRGAQDSIADVASQAGEIIQQIKTVQIYSAEAFESKAFSQRVEAAFSIARRRIINSAILMITIILLVFLAIATMLWVGGQDVLAGRMSGGELGAFVIYAVIVASAVATVSEVFSELQRAAGATERLLELLNTQSVIQPPTADLLRDPSACVGTLELRNVSFRYPSRPEYPALNQVSLTIPAGKSLALVGPSGAGKSTLFELLQRFYDPSTGEIVLDNINLAHFEPSALRAQLAVVSQQPTLFTANVEYNIRYGKPDAGIDEIIAAAKAAHAHEFIEKLPNGYQTELGEQGVQLSGGQRQRIAIARAILKNPKILLLDEATSALDSESENQVTTAIQALMKNRTTLIIAHRMSTIRHVDNIAVLEDGNLIDVGTHRELMQRCELYAKLYNLQFREAEREPVLD